MAAYGRPLVNTFSWSLSRQQMFNDCRRQYYLNYYGAWGGWADEAPSPARLAYRLKQIVGLDVWVGDILHRVIESELAHVRRGFRPRAELLKERARSLLNLEWKQSIEQRWRENAKHNRNLFEHYYGMEVDKERRARLREKLFTCLDSFGSLPLLAQLAVAPPEAWITVEQLDTFVVDCVPVYVKIDCAVALDGLTWIIDWKSGKGSDRDAEQTFCYGLYAMQKWGTPLDRMRTLLAYLFLNETREEAVTAERALAMQERIVSGIHAMRGCLRDPAANVACEDDFPLTDNHRLCRRCCFHELCHGAGPIGMSED
jgi:hypothetical protein